MILRQCLRPHRRGTINIQSPVLTQTQTLMKVCFAVAQNSLVHASLVFKSTVAGDRCRLSG